MKHYLLILYISLLFPVKILSQSLSPQEEAMQVFSQGNYSEALIRFRKLSTLFPKDPKYFYYIGICMLQTNTDIKEAEKNLLYASGYAVPRDVYFYLGRAFHYQYKFAEALDAYQKFKSFGTPSDIEKLQCDMLIAMARNGKEIAKYIKINVIKKQELSYESIYSFYNEGLKSGQFKTKTNKTTLPKNILDGTDWRYEPFLSEKDIIVFGSNQGLWKKNKELYVARKLKNNQWSRPEYLTPNINTLYDEDFVYFNEAENALYFASKGHNSMGGYDIFKSIYNPDYKSWSEPVNLGYPINSPYNDFLFVPSDDQKTVLFCSDRETSGTHVMVYQIEFEKNYTFSNIPAGFVFKNVLPDTAEKTPTTITPVIPVNTNTAPKTDTVVYVPPARKSTPEIKKNPEVSGMDEYNQVINNALVYQLKADSVNRIINDQRDLLNNARNDAEKGNIKTKIFQLDKKARQYQVIADSLYIIARKFEKKTTPKQSKEMITDEITQNTFSQNKSVTVKPTTSNTNNPIPVKPKKKSILYEFKVMSKSPYKTVSEIPLNQPLPDGVVYRIQMGAFSKVIEPDRFKGIIPISGETVNNQVTKYYAGLFGRFSDAEKALNKIKEYGFKDSFIVSFYNGKSIPTNRAQELEKNN